MYLTRYKGSPLAIVILQGRGSYKLTVNTPRRWNIYALVGERQSHGEPGASTTNGNRSTFDKEGASSLKSRK